MIATGEPRDEEMAERIRRHRMERPPTWATVEEQLHLEEAISHDVHFDRRAGRWSNPGMFALLARLCHTVSLSRRRVAPTGRPW